MLSSPSSTIITFICVLECVYCVCCVAGNWSYIEQSPQQCLNIWGVLKRDRDLHIKYPHTHSHSTQLPNFLWSPENSSPSRSCNKSLLILRLLLCFVFYRTHVNYLMLCMLLLCAFIVMLITSQFAIYKFTSRGSSVHPFLYQIYLDLENLYHKMFDCQLFAQRSTTLCFIRKLLNNKQQQQQKKRFLQHVCCMWRRGSSNNMRKK